MHPEVINAHLDGDLLHALGQRAEKTLVGALDELSPAEAAVLACLRRRIAQA